MKRIKVTSQLVAIFLLVALTLNAQQAMHYKGNISLDSLTVLNIDIEVTYSNHNSKDFAFYLNKNAEIEFLNINGQSVEYTTVIPDNFLPDLKQITIKNQYHGDIALAMKYHYPLTAVKNKTFRYNPHWIELSFYTGWFPVNPDDKNYSFELTFELPANYQLISSGEIRQKGNVWTVKNADNTFDIPVVISDRFQVFATDNQRILFYGVDLSPEISRNIQQSAERIYDFYEKKWGSSKVPCLN